MDEQKLLALQSLLATLQFLNAGLAALSHISPVITICIGAACVGLQSFVQKAGNELVPQKTKESLAVLADLARDSNKL